MIVSGFVYYQPGFEHVNYKTTPAAQCFFIIVYDHFTLGCNIIMALVKENKIFIRQIFIYLHYEQSQMIYFGINRVTGDVLFHFSLSAVS